MTVDWFENDMGFASGSLGGEVYQWDLINSKDNARQDQFTFVAPNKGTKISSVAMIPGKPNEFFAVGTDNMIYHHMGTSTNDPYDAQVVLKQVAITFNAKALFGGVGDPNKPGSIIVYKISEDSAKQALKLERLAEVQAHSSEIERMRLTYDNQNMFTVGKDGCLMIHDVKERDPKARAKMREVLPYADEILTEKAEIDQ